MKAFAVKLIALSSVTLFAGRLCFACSTTNRASGGTVPPGCIGHNHNVHGQQARGAAGRHSQRPFKSAGRLCGADLRKRFE